MCELIYCCNCILFRVDKTAWFCRLSRNRKLKTCFPRESKSSQWSLRNRTCVLRQILDRLTTGSLVHSQKILVNYNSCPYKLCYGCMSRGAGWEIFWGHSGCDQITGKSWELEPENHCFYLKKKNPELVDPNWPYYIDLHQNFFPRGIIGPFCLQLMFSPRNVWERNELPRTAP